MGTLWQDIRYGFRMLARNRAFSAVVVLTLALGIWANAGIFSIVNIALLRPLPFKYPDRLVVLQEINVETGEKSEHTSYPTLTDWRAQTHSFEYIGAYVYWGFDLLQNGQVQPLSANLVSADFLNTLGIVPTWGRNFLPEEEKPGQGQVAVISYELWRRIFGSEPGILGKILPGKDTSLTIVGVLPPQALGASWMMRADVLIPLSFDPEYPDRYTGGLRKLRVLGRLKQRISLEEATAEMDTIASRLAQQYPESNAQWGVRMNPLHEELVGESRGQLLTLQGIVGFLLAIACANVANLWLARATVRQREFAIRLALGAGSWRVVRQILTESVLLALVGGALGLFLSKWMVHLIQVLYPERLPRAEEAGVDIQVVGFTFLLALLTGGLCALVAALQSAKPDLNQSLKEGNPVSIAGWGRQHLRSGLVVLQIGLAMVLLTGAGLLLRSFWGLLWVNPGFNPDRVLSLDLGSPAGMSESAYFSQVLERLRVLPGVEAVGVTSDLPFRHDGRGCDYWAGWVREPASGEVTSISYAGVSPDYLRVMKIPLMRGRWFTDQDGRALDTAFAQPGDSDERPLSERRPPCPVIVSEQVARRLWLEADPIGQRLTLGSGFPLWPVFCEVVGVVGDVKKENLRAEVSPMVYCPYFAYCEKGMCVTLRTLGHPTGLLRAIREEIRTVASNHELGVIVPLEQRISESFRRERRHAILLSAFAGVAWLLVTVGIYGVMSYTVSQRVREIGIRMALGASSKQVLQTMLWHSLKIALVGVGLGLVGAVVLTRVIASLLFGVTPRDPLTFLAVGVVGIGVAVLASYLPAHRAARIDPMVALRHE